MVKRRIEEATQAAMDGAVGIDRATEIEQWPIARVKPYKRNAKLHPPEQVAMLARLMERHGFDQPIVVDKKGTIVKGHGRWLAAKQLSMATIPVVVRELDAGRAAEARIADNRSAMFGWDFEALVADVVANMKLDFDVELTGYTLEQLGLTVDEDGNFDLQNEPQADAPVYVPMVEPETPDLPKVAITKPGDVWRLGRHTLLCGDATQQELDEKPHAIFTDPPYGVNYQSHVDESRRKNWGAIANDHIAGEELQAFLRATVPLAEATFAFVCCDQKSYATFEHAFGEPKSLCVWDKGHPGLGNGYRRQYELVMFFGTLNRMDLSDVWAIAREHVGSYKHPTQKPVALVAKALADVKAKNVYDPFGGSGSTLLAAEQLGIDCTTIELEPKYCDVIVERWEQLTGKKAKRG